MLAWASYVAVPMISKSPLEELLAGELDVLDVEAAEEDEEDDEDEEDAEEPRVVDPAPVSYTHLDVYKRQTWCCRATGPRNSPSS